MSNILEETKFIMKKYHIKANKSLGQNFLIDDKVVEEIISGSNVNENDLANLGEIPFFPFITSLICLAEKPVLSANSS